MAEGMHTQMPVEHLGENVVQRCRKIWWTVYILDREMTSLMGLPQSLSDDHINTLLPEFPGSLQRTAGINMHIKLSRIIAEISSCKYPLFRSPNCSLLNIYSRLRHRWTPQPKLPPAHKVCPRQCCQTRRRTPRRLPSSLGPSQQWRISNIRLPPSSLPPMYRRRHPPLTLLLPKNPIRVTRKLPRRSKHLTKCPKPHPNVSRILPANDKHSQLPPIRRPPW